MKSSPEQRDKLKQLAASFARTHKMLLEIEMTDLEKTQGIEIKPAARLNMLLNDPQFNWLRNLSQLMAITDDLYFQKEEIEPDHMLKIREASENLFLKNSKPEFTEHYERASQKSNALMLEHASLVKVLKTF